MIVIFIVIHIILSVIAYGISFGAYYQIDKEYLKYCRPKAHEDRIPLIIFSMFGFASLLIALLVGFASRCPITIKFSNKDLIREYEAYRRAKFDYDTFNT